MALLRAAEVRAMAQEDRRKKLTELRGELMHERGIAAMGGSPPSPGKIRRLRTAIARILTIENQARSGGIEWAQGETPKVPAAAPPPARRTPRPAPKAGKPAAAPKTSPAPKGKASKTPSPKSSKPKEAKTGGMNE